VTNNGNLQQAIVKNSKTKTKNIQVSCDIAAFEQNKLINLFDFK
jgi:hypothetical protein